MRANIIRFIIVAILISTPAYGSGKLKILPSPTSDRTFQFLRISKTFMGTPLQVEALVPNMLIVIGEKETPEMFIQVANMAYMIGQWSQDPGTSVDLIRKNLNLPPVVLDINLSDDQIRDYNLVIVGANNRYYKKLKDVLRGEGSFIEVVEDGLTAGRDIMVVSDRKAAFYLGNKRLYFKSGAYKGFYNFVKTRLLIEKGNFDEALFSLDNPEAIRGCGKPVILAIGHKENLPPEMLALAKKRNKIVFKDLRGALESRNRDKSIAVWQSAMETCYACHQGTRDVKKYRKFNPIEGEHSYHHNIVKYFGFECSTCHTGKTRNKGY